MRRTTAFLSAILALGLSLSASHDADAVARKKIRRVVELKTPGGAALCTAYPTPEFYLAPDDATEYCTTSGGASSITQSSGALTYDWWQRCTATPALNTVALGREPGGQVRNGFGVGEELRFTWYVGGGAERRCRYTSNRIVLGQWQHWTFTFDPTLDPGVGVGACPGANCEIRNQAMAQAYRDGVLDDFDLCQGTTDPTTDLMVVAPTGLGEFHLNQPVGVGAAGGMNCEYARVRLIDGALSAAQVLASHLDSLNLASVPTRVRWFEDTTPSTTTVTDESGSGNNGTCNALEAVDVRDTDGPIIASVAAPLLTATGNGFFSASNGQSLSVGTNGTGALSTVQVGTNLRAWNGSSFPALVETTVETHVSASANQIRTLDTTRNWVGETYGGGGTDSSQHVPGGARFAALVAGVQSSYTNRGSGPGQIIVPDIEFIQGEADATASTPANVYLDRLFQMQAGYEAQIRTITGQTQPVPIFISQISSNTAVASGPAGAAIADAQVCAQEQRPNRFFISSPKYGPDFSYSDGVHGVNTSYRDMGNRLGIAKYEALIRGRPWRGLTPRFYRVASSTNIQACFNVPCTVMGNCGATQLTLDTTLVTCPRALSGDATCRYGFELFDPNPQPRYITAVAVSTTDPNCVDITTDSAVQSGSMLSIGYLGIQGALAGNGSGTSAGTVRSNLRDTTTITGLASGTALYNWAAHVGRRAVAGGANPTATIARLIDDQRWSWLWTGANCPAGDAAWTGTPINIPAVVAAGSHTCANATPGSVTGIFGSSRVNQGMNGTDGTALSASSWATTGAGTTTWNQGADDYFHARYIGQVAEADATHGTVRFFTLREDTTNADISLQISTAGTFTFQVTTQASDVTHNFTEAAGNGITATPTYGVLDVFIAKRGWSSQSDNCVTVICWNGHCNVSGATGRCGAWGPGNLTLGGNQSGSSTNYWSYIGYAFAVGERARNKRGASSAGTGLAGSPAFIAYHTADYNDCVGAGYCQ